MDSLLGTDRDGISCIMAVAKKWLWKLRPLLGSGRKQQQMDGIFCAVRAEML
jgi:hypothetical protein